MVEITARELGMRMPRPDEYRLTIYAAGMVILVLLLLFINTDIEEKEGVPARFVTLVALLLLAAVWVLDLLMLLVDQVEKRLAGAMICAHCHAVMPAGDNPLDGRRTCWGCERLLRANRGTVKVNYGDLLPKLGIPKLLERFGKTKLEQATWIGAEPGLKIAGDLIEGDKVDVRDSVIYKSKVGGSTTEDDLVVGDHAVAPEPVTHDESIPTSEGDTEAGPDAPAEPPAPEINDEEKPAGDPPTNQPTEIGALGEESQNSIDKTDD